MNNIDSISIFLIALSASFSHCFNMCGGIVITYSTIPLKSKFVKFVSHFVYGFGRITTYMIIGAISAFFGNSIAVSQSTRGGLFVIVGLIMILFGVLLLLFPKLLIVIESNLANTKLFKNTLLHYLKNGKLYSFYLIGLLNGIMPCGMVYFFALSASVSGGIFSGIFIMFVFGCATLLPMVLFGMFNSLITGTKYKNIINKILYFSIICFGVYTMIKGINILFL